MTSNDVLAYLEPVTNQNISMVKMMLLAFDGRILDDQIKGNKVLIVLKGFGCRPLPTIPGFIITVCNPDSPPQFTPPRTTIESRNIKSLFDKTGNENAYKYDDLFRHYLNPSITIPTVATFLILYTCYKLLEFTL
ncbi:hypothetical protein BMR1_01G00506 [Babesia microti strain RI]|uniref:Uncharacterized protein n=1 Tax=Babesia microti (strain RI) TaxID=1133968 RepID=A0A1N6LWC8_BABMR|nr:hypothetical protein BMR1_01G00506 [Babesia microti strain RI]SIO73177.1 hypothetical protein BMR1_01G00506 [Babesia microti strain RI]|eukprot:XP_021337286.1 hypothetical protein BMR1_01G00506 [Babesia microti strain RI]